MLDGIVTCGTSLNLLNNLKNVSLREGITRYALVYLTTDYTCPENELEESADEYSQKRGSNPNIYWLSWRMLYDV